MKLRVIIPVVCGSILIATALVADGGKFRLSPHGSVTTGVYRVTTFPRGSCAQCHSSHEDGTSTPFGLFREDSNDLCMGASAGGCHADLPSGASAGYPAQEGDRMPLGSADPGYFQYNSGGNRIPGVNNLVRWPGRNVWQNTLFSPHANDPSMPKRDAYGNGACQNCHDVHGGASIFDMLDSTYSGISNSQIGSSADNYKLCLGCHSQGGPVGMPDSSKHIAEYYDRSINPGLASGHGISSGSGYVPSGARLPCYDCHNPHGSQGHGGAGPNRYLLSDQRDGWWGLTDIKTDSTQVRRFCFGCHRSSDGLYGGIVEGVTMASLPNDVGEHSSTATRHCYDCHGRDYSSGTSHNVHNPAQGN